MTKVSIVVPSFNQARFLTTTLDSILSQRADFTLECIVMDGGSTDGSVDVIRAAAERAAASGVSFHWTSERDAGQADAIMRGMARATGDVLAYLNSDDLYLDGTLDAIVRAFDADPALAWVTGDCRLVDDHGREIQRGVRAYRRFWLRRYTRRRLLLLNFIAQPATFWRRSAMERIGTFDAELRYTMDYDYWLRLSTLGAPVVLERALAEFRIHGASKGGSRFREQFDEDYRVVCRYTGSKVLRALHRLHNALVVTAYRVLK